MDSTLLRLLLLAVGILVLVGIYWWETRRRNEITAQARSRAHPESQPRAEHASRAADGAEELDNLDAELARLSREVKVDHGPDGSRFSLDREARDGSQTPLKEQHELFGFSAEEEVPLDVPNKIIQINIRTKGEKFTGPALRNAVKEVGLQHGEMQIYHRYTTGGRKQALFSMASMVEPGYFPLDKLDEYATPGVTLFAQLPGPGDGMAIFSDMLYTAERLASLLGGVLQDETHSTLTKQTIETLRSEILEHRRQVQLARRRR